MKVYIVYVSVSIRTNDRSFGTVCAEQNFLNSAKNAAERAILSTVVNVFAHA